jgi:hypothetical protein
MLYEVAVSSIDVIEKRILNSMIHLFTAMIERQASGMYRPGGTASQGKLFLRQIKPHDKTAKWQMNDDD